MTNYGEDFSESVEYYVFYGDEMRRIAYISPQIKQKYEFLKNYFDGIEYSRNVSDEVEILSSHGNRIENQDLKNRSINFLETKLNEAKPYNIIQNVAAAVISIVLFTIGIGLIPLQISTTLHIVFTSVSVIPAIVLTIQSIGVLMGSRGLSQTTELPLLLYKGTKRQITAEEYIRKRLEQEKIELIINNKDKWLNKRFGNYLLTDGEKLEIVGRYLKSSGNDLIDSYKNQVSDSNG